ncbi:uncharacterized protein LOC135945222 [Cloeon dipterum]|uniref:uncharacterized protein LOC135945222 n=1 Tax=Cloeon dipterum TaxID=197152 RepID=UPI0032204E51
MDDNSVTITIDNDGFTEIVFASKLDLERCQYFRDRILQLEKHPEEETLYIEDVDPDAFHNFLKCLKKNLVKSTKFDALIPLATLAERFGAEELGNLCVKELTKNLSENNIWQTYNEYLNSKYITLACEEVLMSNTEEFLNSPKFLDIDPETLSHFLSLKKLDMVDKSLLVYCCDKYTWKNTSKDSLPLKEQRKLTGVKLDALIPLTASAERFDAELLGRFCIDELKKNLSIHNIWEIYNEHLESRYITIACLEVLNTNTEEFLKSPRFLDIDLETLCDFLSFMKTGLANEAVLVDYCDKYASTKKHGDSVYA